MEEIEGGNIQVDTICKMCNAVEGENKLWNKDRIELKLKSNEEEIVEIDERERGEGEGDKRERFDYIIFI